MNAFQGRVVMITGAGQGIGRATALAFAAEGAELLLCDLDESGLDETRSLLVETGTSPSVHLGDVSDPNHAREVVGHAISTFGALHVAFNNAGITGPMHSFVGYPHADYQRVFDVNVGGTWTCMQAQIPAIIQSGGGCIVNASSGLGEVGAPGVAAYAASKHAILGLTKVAAIENAALGVRINAVVPGVIDTSQPAKLTKGAPDALAAMVAGMPIGRIGRPEEVAAAVLWLSSDASSFVVGHGLAVDGGYLAQ